MPSKKKPVIAWGLKDRDFDGEVYKQAFYTRKEACKRRDEIYGVSGWYQKVIRVQITEVKRRVK